MNNKEIKTSIIKKTTICVILFILIITLSIIMFKTDILKSTIDKTTTSYISIYNKTNTDTLEINNITKMSDKRGKSNWNKNSLDLDISGDNKKEYEIIIYPKINNIDFKYIKIYLKDTKELVYKNLSELKESEDGGKIIYKGNTYNSNMILKLWIDDKYKKDVHNNSFEVKIKPR